MARFPSCAGPMRWGEPIVLDPVDGVLLEESLATDFAEYRRRRLPLSKT